MSSIFAPEKIHLRYILVLLLLCFASQSYSQSASDSVFISDARELISSHPYFNFKGQPLYLTISEHKPQDREGLFYFIVALILFFALMRLIFYKYVSTMFTLFFRATLRQQQLREQMLQARLPALLMNIFFVVSAATYSALLAMHYQVGIPGNFWKLLLYGIIIIAAIYLGKFILLNILGWIFGISNSTDTYLFIVFLVNKMIAIFLLPFIVLLAFPTEYLLPVFLILSFLLVGGMFIYRFMISYRPLKSEIKLTRLQFFLYLCAFEIAPLLLIYKVLLTFEVSRL